MGKAGQAEPTPSTDGGFSGGEPWNKGCQGTTSARGTEVSQPRALLAGGGLQEEVRERTGAPVKKRKKRLI